MEQLLAFEATIGHALPEDYRRFLIRCNGGLCAGRYGFRGRTPSEGPDTFEAVIHQVGGLREESYCSLRAHRAAYERWLPEGLLWIMGDPFGNAICLGVGGDHRGRVFFWEHEGRPDPEMWTGAVETAGNVVLLANSFSDFVAGICDWDDVSVSGRDWDARGYPVYDGGGAVRKAAEELVQRAGVHGQNGATIAAGDMRRLMADTGARFPSWLAELLESTPLSGLVLGRQAFEPDDDSDGMLWLEISDAVGLRSASLESDLGRAMLDRGFINIALGSNGSGDHYFVPIGEGEDPRVYQLDHGIGDEPDADLEDGLDLVAYTLSAFFRGVRVALVSL